MESPRYFSVWDYVVFGVMLLVSALIGVYSAFSGGRQRTADEFLLGNRKMSVFPVAMSIAISYVSAVSVIGTPAEIYSYGSMFSWNLVTNILGNFLVCRLFLPVFFRIRVISVYEYLEMRFCRALRIIVNIAFSLQLIVYLGIVMYTPALALNAVTGFSLWICVLSTGIVCIFYTTVGGIKAVLWTDTLQAMIMILGIIVVIIKGTIEVGGLAEVWRMADEGSRLSFLEINPDPRIVYSVWNILIGLTVLDLSLGANQVMVQRILACGTLRKATQAVGLATAVKEVLFALVFIAGLVMYAYYEKCDPLTRGTISSKDQLMPLLVMDLFAHIPGLPGLFLSSVVSASLSTLSSGINSLAATTGEDGVKIIWPNMEDQTYARITKIIALGYGAAAIAFAYLSSILSTGVTQLALSLNGMISGGLLGVFILGVFMSRCNAKGAIAGFVTSFFFLVWIKVGAIFYPSTRGQSPLSVEGCSYSNSTSSMYTEAAALDTSTTFYPTTMNSGLQETPAIADLYQVSFVYYTPIGCIVCVIVGMIISGLTGFLDSNSVDDRLKDNLTDALFCCLPESLKRWMRCGVDKYHHDEHIDEEKNQTVVQQDMEEMKEVYTRKISLDNTSNGHVADPPTAVMESKE